MSDTKDDYTFAAWYELESELKGRYYSLQPCVVLVPDGNDYMARTDFIEVDGCYQVIVRLQAPPFELPLRPDRYEVIAIPTKQVRKPF